MRRSLCNWVAVLALATMPARASSRSELWQKARDAIDRGLPKSAIAALKPIVTEAVREKRYAEAIKALGLRIAQEGHVEGDKPEERIVRLQAEIGTYPTPMRPVLEAILAHWYWQYFQENRWQFSQRTQSVPATGRDIQTWDLPRILAETDAHFTTALSDAKALQNTPIAAYDDLLDRGTVPDTYRPTLFDFLAYDALSFYVAGEQAGSGSEDAFELTADSPIFAPAAEFLRWQPASTEGYSPTRKAVALYQKLLGFHANDRDKSAFLDADFERLRFGHNKATAEDRNDRYKDALQRLAREHPGHEISARALAECAQLLYAENEYVEARRLAQQGLRAFPKSAGGVTCFNLIQQIEAKSSAIQTERVWNEPLPDIRVTYRNVTKVFFRAVPYDFEAAIVTHRWDGYTADNTLRAELLSHPRAREWSADLPATDDYRERVQHVPAPRGLEPGFYYIISSYTPEFREAANQIGFAPVWVSDLALVIRQRHLQGIIEGFVLKAATGAPVAGATVRSWIRDQSGWSQPDERTKTDSNGEFHLGRRDRGVFIMAQHGESRLSALGEVRASRGSQDQNGTRTLFFTDRALYRPGQTIHYKGLCYRFDQALNRYETQAGGSVTITFSDPNGKEIARASHRCNDYGSFDGEFTAPRDRLTGQMSIRAQDGATSIAVEEYKRPKFHVELSAPQEAAQLGARVLVPGKATAYTGAGIGRAKVAWRVVRTAQFPVWCWWGWRGHGDRSDRPLAHGTTRTEDDGSFTIAFDALPDRSMREKDEPIFEYRIHADVTETNGETRSDDQFVRAGYTALRATLSANEWQSSDKPVEMTIATASIDGEPQAANGSLQVYELIQPSHVSRDLEQFSREYWYVQNSSTEPAGADPNSWALGPVIARVPFRTEAAGKSTLPVPLKAGAYKAMLETHDRFGKPVTARLLIRVIDPKSHRFPIKIGNYFAAPKWRVEPGERLVALWGTGYETGRAFVEIEHRGKRLRAYWTAPGRTQELVEEKIREDLRGGFTLRVTYVRENRAYLNERLVDVPWSNKTLELKWEHFRSRLDPGGKETWTASVVGHDGRKASVEMVAALYDASLDQYLPHAWIHDFGVFRREAQWVRASFANGALRFWTTETWMPESRSFDQSYRAFPREIVAPGGIYIRGGRSRDIRSSNAQVARPIPVGDADLGLPPSLVSLPVEDVKEAVALNAGVISDVASRPEVELGTSARKNLAETAFFFPQLRSDADGTLKMEFTVPEALTQWRFLGFAHDRELRSGFLTDTAVTAKDLMVEPNPPRFVREGDVIEFPVKVSNRTARRQTGHVKLTFADILTRRPMDATLGNTSPELPFDVPEMQSRSFSWRLTVPDGCEFLGYRVVGATTNLSDGEEGVLPVLSRRILVTESLPLPIRGKQKRRFEFATLLASGRSTTLRQQSLAVQMVSQPAWYAIMALPYLMEYPYQCSEQVFDRFYANALARHIANSDPKIRRIFDRWKGTTALDSPLEKNPDLKAVMLEETPWLRQARSESEARRNVGILFDANRLDQEAAAALHQLSGMQTSDGLWPWFPGGPSDPYITLYITTGFGRLRHLGVNADWSPALKSLAALDRWMDEQYRSIVAHGLQGKRNLSPTIALYLYGRSFFSKDQPVAPSQREAFDYWVDQARRHWLDLGSRQSEAHVAIGLHRLGDRETPRAILKSIEERSIHDAELGMFWRDLELSWWWYRAPIETQAMMIEAFSEVTNDLEAVEACKVWLLKQKQTQDWKTTKATADAIYALLLRGNDLLASDALVEVALAGKTITPEKVEAGTGFYEQRFASADIQPEMGRIMVQKVDDGVSWGSVHWQYLEDMGKVMSYEGTPLQVRKAVFTKETTKKGPALKPVTGPLAVGDELVVRIELRTDRDMEYVHLMDQRGSGTEPVNVLSQYRYQDGLSYYESTRDAASHFFIGYLPKGAYVFEYSSRIQQRGRYQTGVASIQSMYAPEFNAHSESTTLHVE